MNSIAYVKFNEISSNQFMPLLNKQKLRKHLMGHDLFNESTTKEWMESKVKVDSSHGCKVRAILIDKQLAGWCGIQLEDGKYEISIVIDENYWGLGKKIFRDVMAWAKDFGHKTVYIHFLYTRPEYKFLRKISKNVYESELFGNKFTTYELAVS
ncbi:GNAT family N-acetyltransferase [Sulfuriflexus mobilis]|uniref:GNAT family N-acetyltransferase n=1 Tax=Sulfuriflexus mobilis TaxID=1811807 RepID=UPI000F818F28|nr:GNAT family N-acetyltransferase [Sulfuriflexus mobilis]